MKKKSRTPIVLAILLIIIGVFILSLPILDLVNIRLTLLLTFGSIAFFNLTSYLITYKDKDLESLLTCIVSVIISFLIGYLNLSIAGNVAIILMIWVAFISLVRLKKADYYNDRRNKLWIIQMVSLAIFILTGLITSINLSYSSTIQTLMFGYFFLINGILELVDPLVLYIGKLNENRK